MAVRTLLSDDELTDAARAVFDDIRATRGSDFVNNFWRAPANALQAPADEGSRA